MPEDTGKRIDTMSNGVLAGVKFDWETIIDKSVYGTRHNGVRMLYQRKSEEDTEIYDTIVEDSDIDCGTYEGIEIGDMPPQGVRLHRLRLVSLITDAKESNIRLREGQSLNLECFENGNMTKAKITNKTPIPKTEAEKASAKPGRLACARDYRKTNFDNAPIAEILEKKEWERIMTAKIAEEKAAEEKAAEAAEAKKAAKKAAKNAETEPLYDFEKVPNKIYIQDQKIAPDHPPYINNVSLETVRDLIDLIDPHRMDSYGDWFKMMMLCKNIGSEALAVYASKKSLKYNEKARDSIRKIFSSPPDKVIIRQSTLVRWALDDEAERNKKIRGDNASNKTDKLEEKRVREVLRSRGGSIEYTSLDDVWRSDNKIDFSEGLTGNTKISDEARTRMKKETHILIQAGTGAGKSFTLVELIMVILLRDPFLSAIAVTSLRTMAHALEKIFTEKFGFVNYLNPPKIAPRIRIPDEDAPERAFDETQADLDAKLAALREYYRSLPGPINETPKDVSIEQYRRTQSAKMKNKSKGWNPADSDDVESERHEYNGSTRNILSLEQLYKINWFPDIVILDEISNIFGHLYSKTMDATRAESYKRLISILKHAKYVLVADALIRDDVLIVLRKLFGDKLFVYRNYSKRSSDVKVDIHIGCRDKKLEKNFETKLKKHLEKHPKVNQLLPKDPSYKIHQFLRPIAEKIEAGESVCIVSDSKRKCAIIESIVKLYNDAPGYVNTFVSGRGKLEKLLNDDFFHKRCVIFSPRIVYGLDIQYPYGKDCVNFVYMGNSINGDSMYQQVGRFRNAKHMRILWVPERSEFGSGNQYISLEKFRKETKERFEEYCNDLRFYDKDVDVSESLKKCLEGIKNTSAGVLSDDVFDDFDGKKASLKSKKCDVIVARELASHVDNSGVQTFDEEALFYEYHIRHSWYESLFKKDKYELLSQLLYEQGYDLNVHKIVWGTGLEFMPEGLMPSAAITTDEIVRERKRMRKWENEGVCDDEYVEGVDTTLSKRSALLNIPILSEVPEEKLEAVKAKVIGEVATIGELAKIITDSERYNDALAMMPLAENFKELTARFVKNPVVGWKEFADFEKKHPNYPVGLKALEVIFGITRRGLSDFPTVFPLVTQEHLDGINSEKNKNDISRVMYGDNECPGRRLSLLSKKLNSIHDRLKSGNAVRSEEILYLAYKHFGEVLKKTVVQTHEGSGKSRKCTKKTVYSTNDVGIRDTLAILAAIRERVRLEKLAAADNGSTGGLKRDT